MSIVSNVFILLWSLWTNLRVRVSRHITQVVTVVWSLPNGVWQLGRLEIRKTCARGQSDITKLSNIQTTFNH